MVCMSTLRIARSMTSHNMPAACSTPTEGDTFASKKPVEQRQAEGVRRQPALRHHPVEVAERRRKSCDMVVVPRRDGLVDEEEPFGRLGAPTLDAVGQEVPITNISCARVIAVRSPGSCSRSCQARGVP